MRFCLTNGSRTINLLLNEVIFVVRVVRVLIVSEDKVFACVTLLQFGGIVLGSEGMFRESFLEFGDVGGARKRVGDGEVVFPAIGNRLLHLGFVLLVLLDVLRLYRLGV